MVCSSRDTVGIYLLKVDNRNTRIRCEICSKLTIKSPEQCQCFIVNFEHISRLVLVFLLLTLNMQMLTGKKMEESAWSSKCRTLKVSNSFPRGRPRKTWKEVIRSALKERKVRKVTV